MRVRGVVHNRANIHNWVDENGSTFHEKSIKSPLSGLRFEPKCQLQFWNLRYVPVQPWENTVPHVLEEYLPGVVSYEPAAFQYRSVRLLPESRLYRSWQWGLAKNFLKAIRRTINTMRAGGYRDTFDPVTRSEKRPKPAGDPTGFTV